MNQQELAVTLGQMKDQLEKGHNEIVTKIALLEEALINAGNISPEVQARLDSLKESVQKVDDVVPDVEQPS